MDHWIQWISKSVPMSMDEASRRIDDCLRDTADHMNMTPQEVIDVLKPEDLVNVMFSIDFPWKRHHTSEAEVVQRMQRLRDYQPKWVYGEPYTMQHSLPKSYLLFKGKYAYLEHQASDYLNYNEISDYFVEPVRSLARRRDSKESMLEFWESHKEMLTKTTTDPHQLRETIWKSYKEVGTFRPTNLAAVMELFGSRRILDFSSGWGDRLIAAMCKNAESYVGVDPNPLLHPVYDVIQDFIRQHLGSTTEVHMIESPFESLPPEALPDDYSCDLVFTSPPYFDWEVYTDADDETQSVTAHVSLENWYNHFLLASIHKALEYLETGGYMVLIITDVPGQQYVRRMIDHTKAQPKVKYLGMIAYAEKKSKNLRSPQPMWIFQKQ